MLKMIIGSLIFVVIVWVIQHFTSDYDKCYLEREDEGYAIFGCCGGMTGGTRQTNYLSEICVGCPYLVLPEEKKND